MRLYTCSSFTPKLWDSQEMNLVFETDVKLWRTHQIGDRFGEEIERLEESAKKDVGGASHKVV
ncbi:Beta-lactamase-like protein [Penicillium expansum]|nr:Beta-lactamase-like protein [Penicillium expansum]